MSLPAHILFLALFDLILIELIFIYLFKKLFRKFIIAKMNWVRMMQQQLAQMLERKKKHGVEFFYSTNQ